MWTNLVVIQLFPSAPFLNPPVGLPVHSQHTWAGSNFVSVIIGIQSICLLKYFVEYISLFFNYARWLWKWMHCMHSIRFGNAFERNDVNLSLVTCTHVVVTEWRRCVTWYFWIFDLKKIETQKIKNWIFDFQKNFETPKIEFLIFKKIQNFQKLIPLPCHSGWLN